MPMPTEHKPIYKLFKCRRAELQREKRLKKGEDPNKGHVVTFPVSYRYNGLIEVNNKLYTGFDVPDPKIPKGFELRSMGCGLQLNVRPPFATMFLSRCSP